MALNSETIPEGLGLSQGGHSFLTPKFPGPFQDTSVFFKDSCYHVKCLTCNDLLPIARGYKLPSRSRECRARHCKSKYFKAPWDFETHGDKGNN